jgi:hypothetical protein
MLTEFGCDEAQGYYFSRPVTPADISQLITRLRGEARHWGEPAGTGSRDPGYSGRVIPRSP